MDPKTLLKKILYPPAWLIIFLVPVCTAALVFVFVRGLDTSPLAYAVYVLSFYTLSVFCVALVPKLPRLWKSAKEKIYANKFGNRYFTDAAFKTHVSLWRSLAINTLYAGINLLSYFLYDSAWFSILALYYMILAVMRFLLLRFMGKVGIGYDIVREYRRARLCGIILLAVNLTLSGAVLMMLYQNKGYEYHGIMIYVMAMYTFYITVHSIVSIVKYRRHGSPVMSAAKIISLSAALVSMLSLETAMHSEFGAETTPGFRQIMIASTGAGVSAVVITLSVYMIVKATKEIKSRKGKRNG